MQGHAVHFAPAHTDACTVYEDDFTERFALVKETISAVAGGLMQALQQDIDEAAKRGEIEKVEASTLMLDMLSLNAFPFLIQPLFQAAIGNKLGNVDKFYEIRKKENIEIIMRRLTPRKSWNEL